MDLHHLINEAAFSRAKNEPCLASGWYLNENAGTRVSFCFLGEGGVSFSLFSVLVVPCSLLCMCSSVCL